MDRIELRGLEVWAHHGVHPDERQRGQRFVLDLRVEADLSIAGASDDLSDTVDYRALAETVAEAATGGPHQLLETVADRVAAAVLADPRARAVEVTVTKPDAPLRVRVAHASVTLRRERTTA